MTHDQLLTGLKKDVRSLLISAKRGLTPDHLKRDYQTMLGYPIPLRLLGFRCIMDMVKEMPDVVRSEYQLDGTVVLKAIGDETTKGIEELVAKQRDHAPKAKNQKRPGTFQVRYPRHQPVILPRRGQAKPSLPAHLRSQLKQLLSHGPVRLSQLESRYTAQFGKPLQITQYGFYSISEMLAAAADFIVMQQSRTGSQLLLRSPAPPGKPMSSPSKQLAKVKPVVFNPKATSSPKCEKIQPSSRVPPAVPAPEPVKRDHSFQERVLKLETELRQQIIEKATAGTVSPKLKDKLRKVVAENSAGISVHNLPEKYKRMYGEELPVAQCGFPSVTEMVGALSDTFSIQPGTETGESHCIIGEFKRNDAQSDPELSPGRGNTSSLDADSADPSGKAFYFSCTESAWEREEAELSTDSQDSDSELSVTNKTIHQMVDLLPVWTVSQWTAVPPDAVLRQKLKPPTQRKERELVPVLVEQIESPSHFYVRFSQNKEARALENMMLEMRSCYSCLDVTERYRLPDAYVRPGQVCCVAPRDVWFYRVVIHEVLSATEVTVYYVDFGDITKVERNSLRFLKACYADLPAQAVPSMLAGIRPITSTWTQSAISFFQKMCCERSLVAAIHGYQDNFLLLFLCDTSTDKDVYIHVTLQDTGHAQPCITACGSVSGQLNPLDFYLGYDQLEDIEEHVLPSTSPPDATHRKNSDVQTHGERSTSSSQTVISCENAEISSASKNDVEPISDLPELEFINVPEVDASAKSDQMNSSEVSSVKEQLCYSDWDQGWTAEDKTDQTNPKQTNNPDDQTKERFKLESAPPGPPVHAAVREPQGCGSPVRSKPATPRSTSPRPCHAPVTPHLIPLNCSYAGVPVFPIHPPLSNFMLQLFSSPDKKSPNVLFQQHASPLGLMPAARLSAGAHGLHQWCAKNKA